MLIRVKEPCHHARLERAVQAGAANPKQSRSRVGSSPTSAKLRFLVAAASLPAEIVRCIHSGPPT